MAATGSVYGYEVASGFPLRRLLAVAGPAGRVEVRRSGPLPAGPGTVVHELESPDRFVLTRVAGDRLHISCSAAGDFLVDPPELLLAAPAGCDADLWEHRLLTTALPLLLAERGDLMLHGGALLAGGRAVVLAGTAGRGKSTAVLTAGLRGHRLLAEDGAAIDLSGPGAIVRPGPRGVRVGPGVAARLGLGGDGSGALKRTVFLDDPAHALEPAPLAAVLVLGERGPGLVLEPVEPAAALPLVLPHLIYGGTDRLAAAFSQCARLVERVAVFRCFLPDGLDLLAPALDELLERVSAARAPVPR